jgi:molybdate transport system regulatory protein
MNTLSEQPLVDRATGGKGGGGAIVTRYGQRLIQLYDLLAQIQQKAFDVLSDDDNVPLDSLLAAISRFSLQTSARNQWFGTVTARDNLQVQQHIEILLADGTTRLKAAITAQSAERLELDEGKEVLVLLKAPWVNITRDPDAAKAADNQLQGAISHIERGQTQCEVLMTLADGQPLCATVPLSEADIRRRCCRHRVFQRGPGDYRHFVLSTLTIAPTVRIPDIWCCKNRDKPCHHCIFRKARFVLAIPER